MSSLQLTESGHSPRTCHGTFDTANLVGQSTQKVRKQALTGGSRAWSRDEELYLLKTRHQKVPYRQIATHLKKTELACRLHYHQLSHGSRRKKIGSTSPCSTPGSPEMTESAPSLAYQGSSPNLNRSLYTTQNHYSVAPHIVQLPSASTLISRSDFYTPPRVYEQPNIPNLPRLPDHDRVMAGVVNTQVLRLDTDVNSGQMDLSHVNLERLGQIYEKHRGSIWNTIASEYGVDASPFVLEEAWKRGNQTSTPPTPSVSPDEHVISYQKLPSLTSESKSNISSLLGINASPRSSQEREIVRRMEERL
ncbi:BgTH12-07346 [Blumeria graminis f. sp. triticale]|uniref:BgTH12-07346 n=1 Tax=Blumeria graminis f. sp. triticale TaxID=1689686 RepID=A0A9W4GK01_BLUGR|nr:BgTH12-07346 [Blumeria graminis f. sp. triticale]